MVKSVEVALSNEEVMPIYVITIKSELKFIDTESYCGITTLNKLVL